uniref:Carnitine O-palmitoyltransferase 1, liver isoform-like n=1 Tax=Hirondellea gigas TaxID=1518452 RepID=A0A2P2HZI7_9CRUS
MADARIAVARPRVPKEDDGSTLSWEEFISSYRITFVRGYFRFRNSLRNRVWPTTTNNLVVVCGMSQYLLHYQPPALAGVTHHLNNMALALPLPTNSPVWLRHVLVSCGISVGFFVVLMRVRQYLLRILLAYRGWMYEKPHEMTLKTRVWGVCVKLVSGYQPSLYSCQRSLPRMPVPPLDATMARLMVSLEPLCSPEELAQYKREAEHFQRSIGGRLQRLLCLKAWWSPNYVSDWWEKYAYLMSRTPLAINSNYYCLDHLKWTPTSSQVARAANVIYSFCSMRRLIDREQLQPLLLRNTIPICMAQYERLFSTVRIPGKELDELVHYEPQDSRHIVVWCQGLLYALDVVDHANQLLSTHLLQKLLHDIVEDAAQHKGSVSESERSVPSLTGLPRTEWATILEQHFSRGINKDNLDIIKKAVFMVVLFEEVPADINDKGKTIMHADGRTLWFDKSLNLCFFPDGQCGFNAEHSMADAPALGHVWEYAMTNEVLEKRYLDNGDVMPPPREFRQGLHTPPRRIIWDMTDALAENIKHAVEFGVKHASDLELAIEHHDAFGKGVLKKAKISPDAFIQIALQLAYYRDSNGKFVQTYEASATRLYQHGRTETVRSCTNDSSAFVRAMCNSNKTRSERLSLLRVAGQTHQLLYKAAMNGEGIDRHLFALYVISRGLGYDSELLEHMIKRPWTLSTSQQPQQQVMNSNLPDINFEPFRVMCSPGGGFAPVSDDGYGVSYMLPTDFNIFFHVSSKRSCPNTDSRRFVQHICRALEDMRLLFEDTPIKVKRNGVPAPAVSQQQFADANDDTDALVNNVAVSNVAVATSASAQLAASNDRLQSGR